MTNIESGIRRYKWIYVNSILILFSVFFAGCAAISITSADGQTKIERKFGVTSVSISPGTAPVLVEMTAVGFSSGPTGYAIGLSRQEIAAIPEGCKVVFWIKNAKEVEAVRRIVSTSKDFCSINHQPKGG